MDIIPQAKKNIILDATIFNTLIGCGRLTDFRFNHNFKNLDGKSPSLEMGSIVHTYLEKYYKGMIDNLPKNTAHEYGLTAAQIYAKSHEVTNTGDEDKAMALDTCQQYYDYYINDKWTPLAVEVVKSKVIYEDDEIRVMWKAKCDLIVDTAAGVVPVDHKTMKQRRDSVSLNNQFLGQTVVNETRLMIVNKIGFQKSLKAQEKFTRATINYTPERQQEWYSEIVPYWAKIMMMYSESGYWPPNWDRCETKYGFCEFKGVCESNPAMRQETLGINFKVGEPWSID